MADFTNQETGKAVIVFDNETEVTITLDMTAHTGTISAVIGGTVYSSNYTLTEEA